MADFEIAYYITNKIEGGYTTDPNETYRGIDRKFNPTWEGWKIIDQVKNQNLKVKEINDELDKIGELQELIKKFYKENYWRPVKGDYIQDQRIANEVYDNAVNMGVEQSAKYLQRTINILNRNLDPDFQTDIKVDGFIGGMTIETLGICLKKNGVIRTLNIINGFQIKHYLELMEANPKNEKYIGWFDRVEIVWK